MNQILVTDKLYVTQKLKRKKKIYRAEFIASLLLVFIFSGWFVYSKYEQNKSEAKSQEILENAPDMTTAEDQALVVAFGDDAEIIEQELDQVDTASYTDENGTTYTYEAILSIPCIGIQYPVLSDTSDELLKISLNKFWGGSPNTVGNYCVVGHNYRSGKMFGKLARVNNGDKVYLQDMSGKKLEYVVYEKYVVDPEDVACTSQITNGLKEMTLITCTEQGKRRLIVKCREA
ncbi:MAG: sortase [Clostridia bacterium]|nr:sortase [Clostridia bacterium]